VFKAPHTHVELMSTGGFPPFFLVLGSPAHSPWQALILAFLNEKYFGRLELIVLSARTAESCFDSDPSVVTSSWRSATCTDPCTRDIPTLSLGGIGHAIV
jgi:hypothetical protein